MEEVPFGGAVEKLPEVPNRGEQYWKWDAFDSGCVYYSMTVEGEYVNPLTTLATGEERPAFLVEGTFYEGQKLTAAADSAVASALREEAGETLSGHTLSVNDYTGSLTVRMRQEKDGVLYTVTDGAAVETTYTRDGSYLVFSLENGGSVVFVPDVERSLLWVGAIIALLAAGGAALVVFFVRRRRHHK